jgi:hypothetical protein
MVRRRPVASLARRCKRSWWAYRQGSDSSRNGAGFIWKRWPGCLGGRRCERPASRSAGTHRSSRIIGSTDDAIGAALLEARVNGDSSVERRGVRPEVAHTGSGVGPNATATSGSHHRLARQNLPQVLRHGLKASTSQWLRKSVGMDVNAESRLASPDISGSASYLRGKYKH